MKISCFGTCVLSVACLLVLGAGIALGGEAAIAGPAPQPVSSTVVSLDGDGWLLATDPTNIGREEKWFEALRPEAKPTKVPWIIQDAFPGYHGVACPQNQRIFEKSVNVTIAKDTPFAVPIWAEDIAIDAPSGRYRFLASVERGGAATGGEAVFYVADPADMPAVKTEIVLAGEDTEFAKWLGDRGIRCRQFVAAERAEREVILVSKAPPAFEELWRRVEQGAAAVFLTPEVFQKGDQPLGWLPLQNKGSLTKLMGWLYHKDEWAKAHPVFDGLPSGGLMDYAFYREIIPELVFAGQDPPAQAIAGANNASFDYSSGLMLAEHRHGAGRYLLNTLPIREQLSTNPVAERLLRNLLNHAASQPKPKGLTP